MTESISKPLFTTGERTSSGFFIVLITLLLAGTQAVVQADAPGRAWVLPGTAGGFYRYATLGFMAKNCTGEW